MKYAKGVCWIGDCRIPFLQDEGYEYKNGPRGNSFSVGQEPDGKRTEPVKSNDKGRFTPNLLVCDDMLNDGTITKGQKNPRIQKTTRRYGENNFTNGGLFTPEGNITDTYNDKGSSSRYYNLDLWFNNMIDKL